MSHAAPAPIAPEYMPSQGNAAPVRAQQWFRPIAAAALAVALGAAVLALDHWSFAARTTLFVFGLAITAWTALKMPDTPVALAAALALIAAGAAPPEALYDTLGHSLIWLLIAAFVMAAVLRKSGVAERVAFAALRRAGSVRSLFYGVTGVVFITAFVVPSTSGRAALLLPVFLTIAELVKSERVVRALALLLPTSILLSASASLLGAGAHLVAAEFMSDLGGSPVDFLDWLLWGAPFALVTTLAATEIILRAFLRSDERAQRLDLQPLQNASPPQHKEKLVAFLMLASVVGWMTAGWHGVDIGMVAIAGALLMTMPAVSGVALKDALKSVEWNLLLFLAATLMLGETLISSGAAKAVIGVIAAPEAIHIGWLVALATVVALLSHILITSRTARATVLIPTLALPLTSAGLDAAALIFLITAASGFCQTFSVSAKPVALFARLESAPFSDRDLLRLAAMLLPMMFAASLAFAFLIWPCLGLSLF
jgi:solute carrier family 13 (sodium-dependent dicarboxylate transporter), member 2/3/5